MSPHEDHYELNLLREEIHRLEQRVDALEHHTVVSAEPAAAVAAQVPHLALPDAIPALGKAVLGLAGAYLLRALAETSPIPSLIVVVFAIVYAAAWLVFALRTDKTNHLAGATYTLTAALILSPLLWEATVRFDVLPNSVAAGILVVFTVLSSCTAITTLACIATALALMIGTSDFAPFAFALLAIAAIASMRGRIRAAAVTASAIAVWLVVYIATRPAGMSQNHHPIGAPVSVLLCALLFAISAAGIGWRGAWLRRTVTVSEIAEAVVTFLLAAAGTLAVTQGRAAPSIGALSAVACAACYFTAFVRFPDFGRNHRVFAAWGAALGLVACFLILPDALLTGVWSAAAVIATLAHKPTLAIHGNIFLLAAGTVAAFHPAAPSLGFIATAAVACYLLSRKTRLSLIPAIMTALSVGALLMTLVNTAIIVSVFALLFAFAASRTGLREMLWAAYAAIVLGSLKLLLIDFRQSHPAGLAVSLLCYGGLLLILPRFNVSVTETRTTNS